MAHFVETDVHPRELEVGGSVVPRLMREKEGYSAAVGVARLHSTAIQAMFARDGLPKCRTDLVALLRR